MQIVWVKLVLQAHWVRLAGAVQRQVAAAAAEPRGLVQRLLGVMAAVLCAEAEAAEAEAVSAQVIANRLPARGA